jgi:hypothetical protein
MKTPYLIPVLSTVLVCGVRLQAQGFEPVPAISFNKPFGGANPLPQLLTVATTGSTLRYTATAATSSGGAWLQISPQGTGCCFTPEAITVSAVPAVSLAAGTYQGQIAITEYPSGANTLTVPVTLEVLPTSSSFFDNVPGQMSFFVESGGSPPAQPVEIRNGGSGTLNWTLTRSTFNGGSWLSLSASSGTAPSLVTIGVNKSGLPGGGTLAGTYVGQIVLHAASGNITIPVSVVVSANVFKQVNAINFTKPFGGANPLPQVLTVASSGTTVRFTATAVNANGGNWLTLSPSGVGCCFTPEAMQVGVNAASSLAAGSYTGQVTFTEYPGGTMSMTVPVTLTVAPSGAPFFDNVQGQMSFSFETSMNGPPPQTVEIRNKDIGILNWNLIASTSDGANWLNIAAPSGTAPSSVAVGIVPASLPGGGAIAGTYVGELVFRTSGSSVSVPVKVEVASNVFNQLNPISFTMPFGGQNPLPQLLSVSTTGGTVRFTASSADASGGSWLSISPQGVGCCFTTEAITATVNASTLAAGSYTGQITFVEYPGGTMSMTVPVILNVVSSGPFFDNVPGQLSFSLATGGSVPPQTIQIRNGGSGSLNWTGNVSTADGGNWLTLSPSSGAAPSDVAVGIVPSRLPGGGSVAGTFNGQVVFGAPGSSVTVPINVTVGSNVLKQLNPISFTMPFGGSNPLPQVLAVASTGSTIRFTASASTATGGNWLSVAPQGVGCCFTPEAMTVSVNASTLAAGSYTGQITFTEYPSGTLSITVPVSLTVAPSGVPFFDPLPGQLSYFLKTGGTPTPQAIEIRNGGSGTLAWTLSTSTSDNGNWLTASAVSGTAPSVVTVGITKANLPGGGSIPGTFTGQLVLKAAGDTVTIPVTVVVGADIFSQVNPISFTKPFGGPNPLPQIVTVAGTGAVIRFTAAATTAKGGNWLQISPQGVGCCFTPEAIQVSVNAASLAAGIYTGQITLMEYPGATQSMVIPVTLTVAGTGPFFDNTQGQVSFSFKPSSTNPPSQTVRIQNKGTGTLQWTVTATTADGGAWLTVSPKSGTNAKLVTVGVQTASLPGGGLISGTYIGHLVFRAPGSSVSVPVSVTIGPDVLTQITAVHFKKTPSGPNPASKTITLASTGAVIRATVTANSANGGTWLQVSPTGIGCCFTPTTFTISLTTTGMPAGIYTGQITFIQYPGGDVAMTVHVTLGIGNVGPVTIQTSGGTPQSTPVSTAFPNRLAAQVTDLLGDPVPGITVRFNAPASGASGTFAGGVNTAVTSTNGVATAPVFTANGIQGAYIVTATTGTLTTNPGFMLTNTAPGTAAIASPDNSEEEIDEP